MALRRHSTGGAAAASQGVVEIRKSMDIEDFVEHIGDAFTPNEEPAKVKY